MYQIKYSRRFSAELSEIVEYLSTHYSVDVASNTAESIMSSISLLAKFPRIGVLRAFNVSLATEYHLLVSGHYFVYYSIHLNEIRIDGIKDSRQKYYSI